MAQSLYTLKGIYYVAGRRYAHNGVSYEPGDVVDGAHEFRNVEAMVRSRHLIPVVDDLNDVPVYYQKDVKTADLVELKFKLKIKKKAAPKPEQRPAPKVEKTEERPLKKAAKKAAAPKGETDD